MLKHISKKLLIQNQDSWNHHRSGWKFVLYNIHNKLHCCNGVKFIGYLDGYFKKHDRIIDKEWVGVLHNPPRIPEHIHKKHNGLHSLESFVNSDDWLSNIQTCRGLIVLSEYCKDYLKERCDTEILKLYHPTEDCTIKFEYEKFESYGKKVVSIGHWLRNFEAFESMNYHNKIMVKPFNNLPVDWNVAKIEHLDDCVYDELLASSVVFLNLYDSSANNAILECINRNTPILINKLPATIEYLGSGYPLFYGSLSEAESLIRSTDYIISAHEYLKKIDKNRFKIDTFVNDLANSELYEKL